MAEAEAGCVRSGRGDGRTKLALRSAGGPARRTRNHADRRRRSQEALEGRVSSIFADPPRRVGWVRSIARRRPRGGNGFRNGVAGALEATGERTERARRWGRWAADDGRLVSPRLPMGCPMADRIGRRALPATVISISIMVFTLRVDSLSRSHPPPVSPWSRLSFILSLYFLPPMIWRIIKYMFLRTLQTR